MGLPAKKFGKEWLRSFFGLSLYITGDTVCLHYNDQPEPQFLFHREHILMPLYSLITMGYLKCNKNSCRCEYLRKKKKICKLQTFEFSSSCSSVRRRRSLCSWDATCGFFSELNESLIFTSPCFFALPLFSSVHQSIWPDAGIFCDHKMHVMVYNSPFQQAVIYFLKFWWVSSLNEVWNKKKNPPISEIEKQASQMVYILYNTD